MKLTIALVIFACVTFCHCAPTEQQSWQTDPEFTGNYFQGDIILDNSRNGVNTPTKYWPNGIIYYKIDKIFGAEHRAAIRTALDIIEEYTCLRFKEVTSSNQLYYVNVTGDSSGCNANVGYLQRVQKVNLQWFPLNTGCFIMGKIVHEFMHAAGFFHMHSNPDRDEYVTIQTANIQDAHLSNFQKFYLNDFGIVYDYASMMHYPPNAFSKNGLPTIVARQNLPPGTMGQRAAMTPSDILKINLMYNCFKKPKSTTEVITESRTTETTTEITT